MGEDYFILVLARTAALQELMMRTEQNIQNQRNAYAETKRLALRRTLYLSEFDILHPTVPVDSDFVGENSEIASLQAEINALIASRGLFVGGFASLPQRRRMHDLKVAKAQKIADYHHGRAQLTESLTEVALAKVVGHRMHEARLLCGYSQKEASKMIGISCDLLRKYETHLNIFFIPSLVIFKCSQLYDVTKAIEAIRKMIRSELLPQTALNKAMT